MNNPKIQNAIVFVTGANRGIGKALVEELINKGAAKIYAAARNKDSILPLMKNAPGKIVPVRLDVTDEQQIEAAARQAGDVNILINNAGRADYAAAIGAPDITSARAEMEVNYFGLLNMTRANCSIFIFLSSNVFIVSFLLPSCISRYEYIHLFRFCQVFFSIDF